MTHAFPDQTLDSTFEALASRHRREIIHALSLQPYSISQLAGQQNLSLPAIHKHIKALERARIVIRRKTGRVTFLSLNKSSLQGLQRWVMQYQPFWGNDGESLGNYSHFLQQTARKEVKRK